MTEAHELKGRVALVTGASRNIGRAIALDLADAGAAVIVNTRGSREAAEAVVREVEARGGEAELAIADVTDEAAARTMGKAGLVGLTKALAHELSPEGIAVNCVVPGLIATAERTGTVPDVHRRNPPLVGRRGRPEDVAPMVRHLAGPAGRYMTAQTIHVNGGAFLP